MPWFTSRYAWGLGVASSLYTPINDAGSTLASAYTAGAGSLVLADGTPFAGATTPFRVTVSDGIHSTIFGVTAAAGATLTLGGAIEGTVDRNYAIGSVVECRLTAGALADLNGMVGGLFATTGILIGSGGGIAAAVAGTDYYAPGSAIQAADVPAIPESRVTNLTTDLAAKAPLASPALTGTPTAPTAATADSSTTLATTAYVKAQSAVFPLRLSAAGTPAAGAQPPWLHLPYAATIASASAVAVTAPTGSALTVNVERSTDGGSTWAAITSSPISVAASAHLGTLAAGSFSTTALSAGDLLRVNYAAVNGAANVAVTILALVPLK